MKKIVGTLVAVLVVLVLLPQATTSTDDSTYDPLADVNRDRVVDVDDLYRVGQAYGSSQTLPFQQNKTVVYVYQLESDPPEVEGARVAIIDPSYHYQVVQVGYTNSSGLVNFTLSSNSNYTAIVWSQTTYNYANFTTNEFGEASTGVQLGYQKLPLNWVTVTFVNKTSGELASWLPGVAIGIIIYEIAYSSTYPQGWWIVSEIDAQVFETFFSGVFILGPRDPDYPLELGKKCGVWVINAFGNTLADSVFTPDENGNANLITYV